jgi:hypothetical protein
MAREYHLICLTCKEFMDLHKFNLVPHVCARSPLGIAGASVGSDDISEGMKLLEPRNATNYWIYNMLPDISAFAHTHAPHDLRLADNCEPDYYWWPEHPGYTEWKEITSSLCSNPEFFLPRNLVDDLRMTDWETAESYLKQSHIILYEELELSEYRKKFDQLTSL